ncbi:hypothetical protein pb186bvf_007776 [Paramecium bursaria]
MIQQQVCRYFNHDDQPIKLICINQQCSKNKRLCYQCLAEKIHDHNQQQIVSISKFQDSIQQKVQEYKQIQDNLSESTKLITIKIENIQTMINEQSQQLTFLLDQALNQLDIIMNKFQQHIYTEETITQALNTINNKQIDQNTVQECWIDLLQELQNIDNKYNKQSVPIKSNPIRILNRIDFPIKIVNNFVSNKPNHAKHIIKHENAEWVQAVSISPCEKYLLSSGCDKKLIIWNLQNYEILQQIQFSDIISAHCFSNCSRIVYLGDQQGKIYNKTINLNYKSQILKTFEISHNQKIEFLLMISVNLLSVSEECVKISMINPTQLLRIIRLEMQIDAIEYSQQDNFLVVADIKNIMIWNARDDFNQILKHQISSTSSYCVKIQLLNQDAQLATAINKAIIIYWIDFEQRRLTEYTRVKSNDEIINLIGQNLNRITYITYNEIIQVDFSNMKNNNVLRQIKEDTYNSPNIRFNKVSNFIITVNDINIVIYQNIY